MPRDLIFSNGLAQFSAGKTCENELFLKVCDCGGANCATVPYIYIYWHTGTLERIGAFERFSDQVRARLLDVLDAVDTFDDDGRAGQVRGKVWRLHQLLVRGDVNPLHWATCNELLLQLAAWTILGSTYGQRNYPDGMIKGLSYLLRRSEMAIDTLPPHHQEAARLCVEVGEILLDELRKVVLNNAGSGNEQ